MYTQKSLLLLLISASFCWGSLQAQVKIGDNPNNIQQNALLELESQQKGLLIPRMNSVQRDAISNAVSFDPQSANSLLIFNSDLNQFQYWNTSANSWLTIEDAQTLTLNNGVLSISGGNTITLPAGSDNQTIALSGNTLSIQNANSVDLTPYLDNTDNQTVTLTGNTLSISNGNSIDLSPYLDNTDAQTISINGQNISIANGNTISLPADNDQQTISLTGNTLSIQNANSVDLTPYLDNTDNQTVTLTGNTLSISNGNSIDLSPYLDNTDAQTITLSGNTLSVSNGGSIDLTPYLDNTDNQTLTFTAGDLTISGGNTVTLPPNTDNQTIALSGNTLSIQNANSVDLTPYLDNTDNQTVILTGNTLSVSNGGSIDLSPYLDNTDNQSLSISGDMLSIAGGNTINIGGVDDQTLSISGSTLSIVGGNSVTLPSTSSVWTTTTANAHYEISTLPVDAEIKYGTGDLDNSSFGGSNGLFWGVHPGEDTGIFTDGDKLILLSPGDNRLIQFWEEDGHAEVAYIESNGQYFQTSDRNLKHNIQTLSGTGLQALSKLNGYRYTYKQCEEDIKKGTPENTTLGIMAQELKEVAPELVQQSDQGHYLVNYDGIIPILIEVNKEQQLIIDEQATTIEAQSKKLSDLEARMQRLEQLLNNKK